MIDVEVELDPSTKASFVIADGYAFNARQSSITEYEDCHRLYGWRRIENLEPDRPQMALEFGSATHVFLQERGRGVPLGDAVRMGLDRLVSRYPEEKIRLPEDDLEILEHRELAVNLWPAYELHWASEDDKFVPLGQEIKGRVEVGDGTGVFVVTQVDRLVNWLGNLWIADYKTMSKNDDRNFRRHEMGMQMTAYVYAASKLLKVRVAGVIIDGLIKTRVPQFRREEYLRTDDELAEFEREFVEICREIATRHVRVRNGENWKTVFYKNTNHCVRYYQCPFYELCLKDSPINRYAYRQRQPDYMDDPNLLNRKANGQTNGGESVEDR